METYSIYINKPRRYITIHKSDCGCCKERKGEHNVPDTESSFWVSEDFNSLEAAKKYKNVGIKKFEKKLCKLCIKN